MQGRKGKPIIEYGLHSSFEAPTSTTPHPGILSTIMDVGARWWGDCQHIFDEMGVAKGQRTDTFLAAFLSCCLCTFILPVRDTSCIGLNTFSITSFMALGVGYCLSTTIIASIYKGLKEISHSSHPDCGGGHFSAHFFYAWSTKNFDTYDLVSEASSSLGMMKFSGLGQVKSFQLEEV
ncbi:hypothetical protein Cgig2_032884 [Carnegiea gigantea]|uniref:Uncharacterized protein n=1 Tax=Carnegiea gigantea TaxID=171969 RepID=A0A9Q1GU82_9CARY|nr:hypothetical protein Cgig2_033062 [Carnegiea gigantea]KAJ8429891.1 hypothetical protein Cgig2_032884 [Carnegiea gigantea]